MIFGTLPPPPLFHLIYCEQFSVLLDNYFIMVISCVINLLLNILFPVFPLLFKERGNKILKPITLYWSLRRRIFESKSFSNNNLLIFPLGKLDWFTFCQLLAHPLPSLLPLIVETSCFTTFLWLMSLKIFIFFNLWMFVHILNFTEFPFSPVVY